MCRSPPALSAGRCSRWVGGALAAGIGGGPLLALGCGWLLLLVLVAGGCWRWLGGGAWAGHWWPATFAVGTRVPVCRRRQRWAAADVGGRAALGVGAGGGQLLALARRWCSSLVSAAGGCWQWRAGLAFVFVVGGGWTRAMAAGWRLASILTPAGRCVAWGVALVGVGLAPDAGVGRGWLPCTGKVALLKGDARSLLPAVTAGTGWLGRGAPAGVGGGPRLAWSAGRRVLPAVVPSLLAASGCCRWRGGGACRRS